MVCLKESIRIAVKDRQGYLNTALTTNLTDIKVLSCYHHYHLIMAIALPVELTNQVTCSACGYNNMTGKATCEGTLANGTTCGATLAQVV